ncbi:hypothetical protein ACFPVX_17335 [Cohnella faecalis]|uniref:Uncharacterized protein n=1 Tax=Cohnella faecalis TaxID=2315694 RepID=A0A398CRI7_9BACL|nr:hypothetical protein [Cohnella faecalis]RIE01524.1 hypothetical protein D3H35_24540 [Cohnella faecalis]
MENDQHKRLLEFLESSFDHEGTMCFLAVSASQVGQDGSKQEITLKVRVALAFREGESVTPYFDGTDLYVTICSNSIQFTNEDEWSEGPPIMEGSPIALAAGWVSELAPPFWISLEAREAANRDL